MELEYIQINENWKKDKFNREFRKNYKGYLHPYGSRLKKHMLGVRSKYFAIVCEEEVLGFTRIEDISRWIDEQYCSDIWCIKEILIYKEHRHKGLAKAFITYLRDHYRVFAIHMTKSRAYELLEFHAEIGFVSIQDHPQDKGMVFVFSELAFEEWKKRQASAANDNWYEVKVAV